MVRPRAGHNRTPVKSSLGAEDIVQWAESHQHSGNCAGETQNAPDLAMHPCAITLSPTRQHAALPGVRIGILDRCEKMNQDKRYARESLQTLQCPVILLSPWYSGATLLTLLLDAQPQIVTNGEAFPFSSSDPEYQCSCGQALSSCDFYSFAASGMRVGDDFSPDLFRREPRIGGFSLFRWLATTPRLSGNWRVSVSQFWPPFREAVLPFLAAHHEFMRRAISYSGATIYVDGTKSLARADLFLGHFGGPKRLLLLIKDCREYCASVLRIQKRPKGAVAEIAREWLFYIRSAERLANRYPESELRLVKYEELCENPDQVLHDLTKWFGVRYLDYRSLSYGQSHVLGNKMRKDFDGNIENRRRWEWFLDADSKQKILNVAGPKLISLGYL